jgi:hypothetical protein
VYDRKMCGSNEKATGATYKIDPDGTKIRFKSRLVAMGFLQMPGSFGEKYAGTPSHVVNRLLFPLAMLKGWRVKVRDVTSAFLLPDLPESEWCEVVPPKGFEEDFQRIFGIKEDEVLVLVKPLYGLVQACARFVDKRDEILTGSKMEMVPVRADPSLFVHHDKDGKVNAISNPHIDDVNMAGEEIVVDQLLDAFANEMPTTGGGESCWHLKVDIAWSKDRRSVEYSQPLYARKILKEAGMVGCRPASTPAEEGSFLSKPKEPATPEDRQKMSEGFDYARITCMLGWLMMQTRPDLCESVSMARTRLSDPRPADKDYVRRILRYLAGTLDDGLRYSLDRPSSEEQNIFQIDPRQFKVLVDSSFAVTPNKEEDDLTTPPASISGGVVMYGGAAIAWWSRKQGRTARSSTDSEIIAMDEGARRALWLRQIGMNLGVEGAETIEIFEDNAQAKGFANDSRVPKRTKYINIKYHATRDDVRYGDVKVSTVPTSENISDAMTKALGKTKFLKFRKRMGVVECRLHGRDL